MAQSLSGMADRIRVNLRKNIAVASGSAEVEARQHAHRLESLSQFLLDAVDGFSRTDEEREKADLSFQRGMFQRLTELSDIEAEAADARRLKTRTMVHLESLREEGRIIDRFLAAYIFLWTKSQLDETDVLLDESDLEEMYARAVAWIADNPLRGTCHRLAMAADVASPALGQALEMAVESKALGRGDGSISSSLAELNESRPKSVGHIQDVVGDPPKRNVFGGTFGAGGELDSRLDEVGANGIPKQNSDTEQ